MGLNTSTYFRILLVFSFLLGCYIYKRRLRNGSDNPLLALILPGSLLTVVATFSGKIVHAPFVLWNAARFSVTYALAHGYRLYYPAQDGPILGHHYGPVSSLLYLPAAFTGSPTSSLILAAAITVIIYFLPVLFLHMRFRSSDNASSSLLCLGAFLCFCLFTFNSPSLSYVAFSTHADAAALSLSAAACAVFPLNPDRRKTILIVLSSSLAVLAIWSKQTALPIVFALPAYILITEGWRPFLRYSKWLIVSGFIISGILSSIFDLKLMWFNMVKILSHQPMMYKVYGLPVQSLLRESFFFILVLASYLLWRFLGREKTMASLREIGKGKLWFLLTIAGLFMVPTSLLGFAKIQGDVNALSYTVYFLCCATTILVLEVRTEQTGEQRVKRKHAVEVLLFTANCFLILLYAPITSYVLREYVSTVNSNPEQIAYQYALKHPGEVYYPWHTLPTLMAEGKAYHFNEAVFERELAGFRLTPEHFRNYVPSKLKEIAFYDPMESSYVMKFFPEFDRKIKVGSLPGWTVYTKSDSH
jgi:hypothetical protein